jgi:hypothetical protein
MKEEEFVRGPRLRTDQSGMKGHRLEVMPVTND